MRFRAPATTANVGPGFDCAAIALDLWNELELGEGEPDRDHLAVRAFALLADPEGRSFAVTGEIPRERGLGSSASVIALGLVAGAAVAGSDPSVDELLALGLPLEGHADNLAAALAGGVCATVDGRVVRLADRAPADAVAVYPAARVSTAAARASLPPQVAHEDAAHTAGHAVLLGAALATGSSDLLAAAASDRLHEPYRAATAPHFAQLRADPPAATVAVTISGSGPTVIVWSSAAESTAAELRDRYPDDTILPLTTTPEGAGPA